MLFRPTPEQVADIQQRFSDGYPIRAILAHYGMADPSNQSAYGLVFNICHRRYLFRSLTDPPTWTPSCMTESEYGEWRGLMTSLTRKEDRVARPCDDCHKEWAMARRAEGLCNGTLPEERMDATEDRVG